MSDIIFSLIVGSLSYLVGSIPTGYFVARYRGVNDLRDHGSGTTGATNTARILGIQYFFLVFGVDLLKSFLCVMAVRSCAPGFEQYAAYGLMIGNAWPIYLGGRGGKGIATLAGIVLALSPLWAWMLLTVWLAMLVIFRTVGFASVAMVCTLIIFSIQVVCAYSAMFGIIGALSLLLHRGHVARLWQRLWSIMGASNQGR